jgi:hypothetical protein
MFILGWTPQKTRYGFGYGPPWSPAGLAYALGAIVSLAGRLWCGYCTGDVVSSSSSTGGRPRHLILVRLGRSQTSTTSTFINAAPGYEEAQAAGKCFQAMPGTGGPKSWLRLRPCGRRERRLIRLRREFLYKRFVPARGRWCVG